LPSADGRPASAGDHHPDRVKFRPLAQMRRGSENEDCLSLNVFAPAGRRPPPSSAGAGVHPRRRPDQRLRRPARRCPARTKERHRGRVVQLLAGRLGFLGHPPFWSKLRVASSSSARTSGG
jgi:hypothetical protein